MSILSALGIGTNKTVSPEWIQCSTEQDIINTPQLFDRIKRENIPLIATEKLDGVHAIYYLDRSLLFPRFGVRSTEGEVSRNTDFPQFHGNVYWEMASRYEMKALLSDIADHYSNAQSKRVKTVSLHGEIVGMNIRGDKYRIPGHELWIFTLYVDGVKKDPSEVGKIFTKYQLFATHQVKFAPILESEDFASFINRATGNSFLAPRPREGIVCRNYELGISFKVINPEFTDSRIST